MVKIVVMWNKLSEVVLKLLLMCSIHNKQVKQKRKQDSSSLLEY